MTAGVRPLSPQLEEVARRKLNEDPNRREQDLTHIKEWLKKQPHLKTARTDDQWLLTFLRGCKFSLERTKEKLDTYYTMRTMCPEFFTNRDPMLPEIQEVLKLGLVLPLPMKDDKGRYVVFLRFGVSDPSKMKLSTVIKVIFMMIDLIIAEDDEVIINGEIVVFDLNNVKLAHATQMTPGIGKKIATCFQEGYPNRPQGMYYFNFPSLLQVAFELCRSLLQEKLKKRLFSFSDASAMHKEVPTRVLPKEYGGEAGTLDELTIQTKKKMESSRDWFLEDESRKSDETKRPGQPKTAGTMFGIEGSFRKLTLD